MSFTRAPPMKESPGEACRHPLGFVREGTVRPPKFTLEPSALSLTSVAKPRTRNNHKKKRKRIMSKQAISLLRQVERRLEAIESQLSSLRLLAHLAHVGRSPQVLVLTCSCRERARPCWVPYSESWSGGLGRSWSISQSESHTEGHAFSTALTDGNKDDNAVIAGQKGDKHGFWNSPHHPYCWSLCPFRIPGEHQSS